MSERNATVALLVVAEHDIDPAAAFRSAAALWPRYYAPMRRGSRAAAAAALKEGVAVLEAVHVEEAIQQAMERTRGIPLLVMSAGETLVHGSSPDAPSSRSARGAAGGATGASSSVRRIPSRILVASGWTRHAPWFGAVRAHVRVPSSHRGALPDVAVERRPANLSTALAAATRSALDRPSARPSRTIGILAAPLIGSLRVYCGGAWRDGVRGLLLAALHGLGALVAVTRSSLPSDTLAERPLEKGSTS